MKPDRVLLVDDEVAFVEALGKRMRARGLDVQIANSGSQAIEKVTEDAFDAVVLDLTMPGMDGILRFWGALVNAIPELLGLFIFAVTSLLTYFIVIDRQDRNLRLLFLAFLMVTVIIRFCALLLRLFFSPKMAKLRLVPLSCEVAQYLHRRLLFIVSAVGVSYVLLLLMSHLEVKWAAQIWLAIILTTTVIGLLAGMIWGNRVAVQEHLLGRKQIACEKRAWLREQYAAMWHILALAYLFLI